MFKFSKLVFVVPFAFLMFTQSCEAQRVRIQTHMGAKNATQAKAKFEQRGNRMKFNIQLEDGLPKQTYGVRILRRRRVIDSGSMTTNQFGVATIDIDTTESDKVLRLQEGDVVQIWVKRRRIMAGKLMSR